MEEKAILAEIVSYKTVLKVKVLSSCQCQRFSRWINEIMCLSMMKSLQKGSDILFGFWQGKIRSDEMYDFMGA